MSTYLELVNLAIQEAGKDQDDLQSADFDSPPDPRMYNRFKRWVNQAYQELQMARNEWEFKTARASVFVSPAVYIENGDLASAPVAGNLLRGQDTGFLLEVQQVVTLSGTWLAGDAEATIYFSIPDNNTSSDFKFNEVFDLVDTDGVVVTADVCRVKGWGRYDFVADGQVPDMLEPHMTSFKIQSTGGSSIQDNSEDVGLDDVQYVAWENWEASLDSLTGSRDKPLYITTAPNGSLELFPRPDIQYVLAFTYTVADLTMAAHDDTPTAIPTRYHPLIAWLAVRKSGMYDRDRTIVARADEHIKLFRNSMERNLMPVISFGTSRYNYE